MPCDYSKYPPNWKSEIRPSVLERAGNCCEVCERLGRDWLGVELNPEYGEMAKRRTAQRGLGL